MYSWRSFFGLARLSDTLPCLFAQNILPFPSSVPGCLMKSCSVFKIQVTKLIPRDVFANLHKQSWSLPLWTSSVLNTQPRVRPYASWLWGMRLICLNIRLSQLTNSILYISHWVIYLLLLLDFESLEGKNSNFLSFYLSSLTPGPSTWSGLSECLVTCFGEAT